MKITIGEREYTESQYEMRKKILKHREKVVYWVRDFIHVLEGRSKRHDESKLHEPEFSMFEVYSPIVEKLDVDHPDYKESLKQMGEGLKHHYNSNPHHPEHYENGVDDMTLIDLVEMFYDWVAVCDEKRIPINIDYLTERFNLSPQIVKIFMNTTNELDLWNSIQNIPVTNFTPEKHQRTWDFETQQWK